MTRRPSSVRGSRRSLREEGGKKHEQKTVHVPVMIGEVVHHLKPSRNEVVVDATYGQGGHSRALRAAARIKLLSIDADPSVRQGSPQAADVEVANFADLEKVLKKHGIEKINKAIFDLGWRREQLYSGRGFSFQHDEPLLMSYGEAPRSGFMARDILNLWSEKAIADALFGYGEERFARRIARAVVERREIKPIETTIELVEIIRDAVPGSYRHGKLHFATKTFQALRVATNDELRTLERGLQAAWKHLACDGRIATITFHSIEDRLVKRLFADWAKKGGSLPFKKPIVPSREEVTHNPASRSAKLRVIEKVCIK